MSNLLLRRENITSNIFDILFLTIILKECSLDEEIGVIKVQNQNSTKTFFLDLIILNLVQFEKNFELFHFVSFSLQNILTFVI